MGTSPINRGGVIIENAPQSCMDWGAFVYGCATPWGRGWGGEGVLAVRR
jgi:hypothetical protein